MLMGCDSEMVSKSSIFSPQNSFTHIKQKYLDIYYGTVYILYYIILITSISWRATELKHKLFFKYFNSRVTVPLTYFNTIPKKYIYTPFFVKSPVTPNIFTHCPVTTPQKRKTFLFFPGLSGPAHNYRRLPLAPQNYLFPTPVPLKHRSKPHLPTHG